MIKRLMLKLASRANRPDPTDQELRAEIERREARLRAELAKVIGIREARRGA